MNYPIGTRIYFYDEDDDVLGYGEVKQITGDRYYLVFDDNSDGHYTDEHLDILKEATKPKYNIVLPTYLEDELFIL